VFSSAGKVESIRLSSTHELKISDAPSVRYANGYLLSLLHSLNANRNPCQVTAVDIPELHTWPDVIIASAAGERSLLSLLSGGGMS
jgi:hypothetical protein